MEERIQFNGPRGRVMLALAAAVWLAGCASAPKSESSAPAKPASPSPAGHPPPAAAPTPAVPPPPAAPAALTPSEVPGALRAAQGLLQEGDADAAQELVLKVLAAEPGNALASSYLRQIESDPVTLLGRESYAYTVRSGESLSSIARDRLRDTNLFYALARYNNIRVPRQLAAGQTIRIPGRAPAATPVPSPTPAPAPTPAPTPAQQPSPAASAPLPPPPPPPPPAPEVPAPAAPPVVDKARRVTELLRQARVSFARQDLCASVKLYDKVLELDANHPQARTERQRSLDLIERLRKQGGKLDC